MNSNIETRNVKMDVFKLCLSLLIAILGVVGFYLFNEHSLLYRVLGLLFFVGLSVFVALKTDKGRQVAGYFHDAQTEVRKVVWPTKQETTQTTIIVVVMVIVVAIFLWLLDMFLGWSINIIMGYGG